MSLLRGVRLGGDGPPPAGPRGLAAAGTGAKVRSGAFARAGPGASSAGRSRRELVCGLLWECLCEVGIVVAGTV